MNGSGCFIPICRLFEHTKHLPECRTASDAQLLIQFCMLEMCEVCCRSNTMLTLNCLSIAVAGSLLGLLAVPFVS